METDDETKYQSPVEIMTELEAFAQSAMKDSTDLLKRVDVFFENYLAVLAGSSDDKRNERLLEFIRVELLCKKLKNFINQFIQSIIENFAKVLGINSKLAKLGNYPREYNKQIEAFNSRVEHFEAVRNNLAVNIMVYWGEQKFELKFGEILDFFRQVVGQVDNVERFGRENGKVLREFLDKTKEIFRKYKKIPFGRSQVMEVIGLENENPCPLVIDDGIPFATLPIIQNANLKLEGFRRHGQTFQISDTCGFSSILYILLASILDDPCYASRMVTSPAKEMQLLFKLRNSKNPSDLVLEFLASNEDAFKQNTPGVYQLSLHGEISSIWEIYFRSIHCGIFPGCLSRPPKPKHSLFFRHDKKINNKPCDLKTIHNYVELKLYETESNFKIKCTSCDPEHEINLELGDQLFIDIGNVSLTATLENFESYLSFLGQKFRLAGVIRHLPDRQHFVAYVFRLTAIYHLYDDMSTSFEVVSDLDFEFSAVALVYIRT